MHIVTIVGARPQFVKAAVVSRAIERFNTANGDLIKETIIHTGQHYDRQMSEIFFEQMDIPKPDYNLHIGSCSHGAMTGRMLEEIEKILLELKPDVVTLYGDTNSTLAGAIAAAKLHIPVAHVEAGLRSFNKQMPEEINRVLTDHIARWLFCPTDTAVKNLHKEGVTIDIHLTGDVMYDAVLFYRKRALLGTGIELPSSFYLATIHREDNTDNPNRIKSILSALNDISRSITVVLPVHPRTKKVMKSLNIYVPNIMIIEPVGYFEMLGLLECCQAVFTDSGGLQKEAYFFRKPCITLRDETEWLELSEMGFNKLVGADYNAILSAERTVNNINFDVAVNLYGDGNAGQKIVEILSKDIFAR